MTFLSSYFSTRCIKVFFLATTMLVSQTAYSVEVKMAPSHPGEIGMQKAGPMAKAGPALNRVFLEHKAHIKAQSKKPFAPSNAFLQYSRGKIVINAVASGDSEVLLKDLKGLGLEKGVRAGRIVSGWLPLGVLNKAVALNSIRFISASYRPITNSGDVTSQGDAAMYADDARLINELDGNGITVGVLSDSYDQQGGAAADVTSRDLPAGVNNLDDSASCGSLLPEPCSDEGRAMMQIVHDVAPGAGLAFHTAFISEAHFAQGIRNLAAPPPPTGAGAGANVIVDDVMYFAEPMFQDGIIAQAVDDVVDNDGVAYFSAAGNQSRDSYEHDYVSSGEPLYVSSWPYPSRFVGILHDFDPGEGVDWLQSIDVPYGTCMIISLQWDQPFGSLPDSSGSQNDIDIYVIDGDENNMMILEKSDSDNVLGGDPVELLQFCNIYNSSNLNLLISYFFEPDPGPEYHDTWEPPIPTFMKYVYFGSMTVNEYATDSSTVYGHANAAGTEATGAAYYMETPRFYDGLPPVPPPRLDYFSSAGGTPILFSANGSRLPAPEVRDKPEIVAPNGVDTTFFYPTSDRNGNGTPDFSGTSAAAPHAAAVAALMLEANMMATPGNIYTALERTAVDMNVPDFPGFDFDSGWGLVKADDAVDFILGINTPPTAGFSYITNYLDVNFTDQSTDDGTIVSWDWNFGDDVGTSEQQNPFYGYAVEGIYNVTLTVTDDDGALDTINQDVEVTAPPNIPPEVSFTFDCTEMLCKFYGSGTDSDGYITAYQWDFGDGNGSTAQDPVYTYTEAGVYTVKLTVTDNDDATGNDTKVVTVPPPADCNYDGICDAGEDCNSCSSDCISGGGDGVCGNGVCEPTESEDCINCPEDCRGKQVGADKRQFCCGDSGGTTPVGCDDSRCTEVGWLCSDTSPAPYCCGIDGCTGAEDSLNCEIDCGPPPLCGDTICNGDEDQCGCPVDCGDPPTEEDICDDGIDNDCDGEIDCLDPDCELDASCICLPKGVDCTYDNDCCSGDCHDRKLTCK